MTFIMCDANGNREMTDVEVKVYEQTTAKEVSFPASFEERIALENDKKLARQALLDKLGITASEAELLLGL